MGGIKLKVDENIVKRFYKWLKCSEAVSDEERKKRAERLKKYNYRF